MTATAPAGALEPRRGGPGRTAPLIPGPGSCRSQEALADFQQALAQLRGNTAIDYTQLGLRFKLQAWEVSGPAGPLGAVHGRAVTPRAPLSVTVTGAMCTEAPSGQGAPRPCWALFYPEEAGAPCTPSMPRNPGPRSLRGRGKGLSGAGPQPPCVPAWGSERCRRLPEALVRDPGWQRQERGVATGLTQSHVSVKSPFPWGEGTGPSRQHSRPVGAVQGGRGHEGPCWAHHGGGGAGRTPQGREVGRSLDPRGGSGPGTPRPWR